MARHRAGSARFSSRDESGAALVEMALVLVLLVMLLVGTISAAVAFGRHNSIQNAAREASRYGATLPGTVDLAWLQSVVGVAKAAASGDLAAAVPGQYICVAIGNGYLGGNSFQSATEVAGVPSSLLSDDCFAAPDGLPEGEMRVQVVTERDTTIQVVLFNADVTISADAAARYER